VYIGDGANDFCAARQCNLVFAKKSLAQHLKKQNLSFAAYKDFNDVKKNLIGRGLFS
jgi:2-hydroxy-3-keto-5-methylthiopentenyl-1-phosphate phosphatase